MPRPAARRSRDRLEPPPPPANWLAGADDADGFGDAIARILGDETLARSLSEKGRARAATFTWDRCADETAAVLRAAGQPR